MYVLGNRVLIMWLFRHKGSAWSEEATFVHSYVPAEFAVSDKALTVFDVLAVSYTATDGYQYVWDTDGATQLAALHDGEVRLQWNTGGKKTIKLTVTAPDGASADYTEEVTVFDKFQGRITAVAVQD